MVSLCQNSRDEFLGGSLAIGAGDGKHNGFALLSVVGSKVLQGLQRVVHNQNALRFWQVFAVGDDKTGYTLLGHLQGEVVGIEILAFQGEEDGVLLDLAAVGRDFIGFREMRVYCFNRIHCIGF